jgi:hypothetical protein
MVFKEKIISYFKETVPEVHKKFDSSHWHEIEELAEYCEKVYIILAKVMNNQKQNAVNNLEFNIALLLWRGMNTIIASFDLIRGGYGIEPLVVARNALETSATALDLALNQGKYKDFKRKKYKSSNAISVASKIIPIFGQFYGILSNNYSHIAFSSSYPQYYKDEKGVVILISGGMYGEENKYYLNLNLCLVGTLQSVFLAVTEFIFFKYCDSPQLWERIDDELRFKGTSGEALRHLRRIGLLIKSIKALD